MSLEEKSKGQKPLASSLKGAAFAAGLAVAGIAGSEAGVSKFLEKINQHVLTPAAIHQLQRETGATEADVARLEANLGDLLRRELKRTMSRE
jgi:hypothetical protein